MVSLYKTKWHISFLFLCLSLTDSHATAETFTVICSLEDSDPNKSFFIVADSLKKTGETTYRNTATRNTKATSKLRLVSVDDFKDGLVGLKLEDRVNGLKYRVDYIRLQVPKGSPYNPDMTSVAIESVRDGRTRASCKPKE